MNKKQGFTLVELSIVLVIVGLLIGGILAAQSMVDTARTLRYIKDIQQYEILAKQFKAQFKVWPGDMPNAFSLFGAACGTNTTTTNAGCNGNGDGAIGGLANYYESSLFWVHISYAGMLGDARYPVTNPQAAFRGGVHGPATTNDKEMLMGATSLWYYSYVPANTGLMTFGWQPELGSSIQRVPVSHAMALDNKFDDGRPGRGKVMAVQPSAGQCINLGSWDTNAVYVPTTTVGCVVLIDNLTDDVSNIL